MIGKAIIISAPSGAGKTSIVRYLLQEIPQLSFSISATTREKRAHEISDEDYYFLTRNEFQERIDQNAFVEWEEVYEGTRYGTLNSEVHRIWDSGRAVIFDVDVVGGKNLKDQFQDNALAIFISVPDLDTLRERLAGRQTETIESLNQRVAKASAEMEFAGEFDEVVINDDLPIAQDKVKRLVLAFLAQ